MRDSPADGALAAAPRRRTTRATRPSWRRRVWTATNASSEPAGRGACTPASKARRVTASVPTVSHAVRRRRADPRSPMAILATPRGLPTRAPRGSATLGPRRRDVCPRVRSAAHAGVGRNRAMQGSRATERMGGTVVWPSASAIDVTSPESTTPAPPGRPASSTVRRRRASLRGPQGDPVVPWRPGAMRAWPARCRRVRPDNAAQRYPSGGCAIRSVKPRPAFQGRNACPPAQTFGASPTARLAARASIRPARWASPAAKNFTAERPCGWARPVTVPGF